MAKKLRFLEENGFIERSIDMNDKRVYRFSMTDKALRAMEAVAPLYENALNMIFTNVSEKHLEVSARMIEQCLMNFRRCDE